MWQRCTVYQSTIYAGGRNLVRGRWGLVVRWETFNSRAGSLRGLRGSWRRKGERILHADAYKRKPNSGPLCRGSRLARDGSNGSSREIDI